MPVRSQTKTESLLATRPPDAKDWDNETWLQMLNGRPAERSEALQSLRREMSRAAYVYLLKRRSDLRGLAPEEINHLAEDYTQEALIIVLRELDGFRGDSKLTTWAYRIVINLAIGKLRRKHWRDYSLEAALDAEEGGGYSLLGRLEDTGAVDPVMAMEQWQVLATVKQAIEDCLTERQRMVLEGIVLNEQSSEELAEKLGTNRNNIYKILHDARKKLRHSLSEMGVSTAQALESFTGSTSLWSVGEAPLFGDAVGAD